MKGSRWLWVKNWENLTDQERAELRDRLWAELAEGGGRLVAFVTPKDLA